MSDGNLPPSIDFESSSSRVVRDAEALTIIEKLEVGPYDHNPPEGDPYFNTVEPHSRIRLSQRTLPHEEVSEFLRSRYYLSPSLVYSLARPTKNRQGYDLPLDAEWVTIAVVAERGDIKLSQGGSGRSTTPEKSNKQESEEEKHREGPKKYTTIKLVDFGSASSDGKGKMVRGDAYLNMMLFEADAVTTARESGSRSVERTYRGGSGGAFEQSSKYGEGSVIAICSPRLLRPYQAGRGSSEKPHPTNNVLGITPSSAESIIVIGKSQDLGHCVATKRDGKPCGSWCDKRVATVCDFHLQQAVKSKRAGRAEFAVGTTGMSIDATHKRSGGSKFDPSKKTGLLPVGAQAVPAEARNLSGDTGAMYIVGSHVFRPSQSGGDEFVSEKLGRTREERVKRKKDRDAEEDRLNQLLARDGGLSNGARALAQVMSSSSAKPEVTKSNPTKSAFSAEAVKRIGFDPTASRKTVSDGELKRKLDMLESLQKPATAARLGKRPPSTHSVASATTSELRDESPLPADATGEEESDLEFED